MDVPLAPMQIRALRSFVLLVESSSIRQAAQRQGSTSTAISRQIDHLEYHFRAELIDRSASGIRLTEAGRLLASHARRILAEFDATQAAIDDLRGLERGHVAIYAGGATVAGLLAPVLRSLHARYPRLRFSITVASTPDVFTALADGEADLGLTLFSPETATSMVWHRTCIEHALIAAPEHPAASLTSVSLRDLAQLPLAIPDNSFGLRRDLDRLARAASVRLDPVFVTGSLDTQKELAIQGAAVLILPPLCCQREIEIGNLVAVSLDAKSRLATTLDLCRDPNRALSFAAGALLDALCDALGIDRPQLRGKTEAPLVMTIPHVETDVLSDGK